MWGFYFLCKDPLLEKKFEQTGVILLALGGWQRERLLSLIRANDECMEGRFLSPRKDVEVWKCSLQEMLDR